MFQTQEFNDLPEWPIKAEHLGDLTSVDFQFGDPRGLVALEYSVIFHRDFRQKLNVIEPGETLDFLISMRIRYEHPLLYREF